MTQALPLYVQTSELLIRELAAGRRLPGERLPPERDMAQSLGISVGTLRKALSDLENRGLLERRQGSGNYIKSNSEPAGIYAFFRLELLQGGGLPRAEVLSVDRLPKPDTLPPFGSAAFGHRIRRLRRLDDQPIALEEIWLDGSATDSLTLEDLSESLYLYYRQSLGVWITRAEDRVGTGLVPDWSAPPFPLAPGAVAGHILRRSEAQSGETIEASHTCFDPAHAAYVSRLR